MNSLEESDMMIPWKVAERGSSLQNRTKCGNNGMNPLEESDMMIP